MARCHRCDRHLLFDTDICRCENFLVWPDDGYTESDAWEIWALSAEAAVKKWAADWDCNGDYDIVRGNERKVRVKLVEGGEPKRFLVFGESEPVYYATATD